MIFVTLALLLSVAYGQHAPPAELMAVEENNNNNEAWMDTFHAQDVPSHFGRTIENLPSINDLGSQPSFESQQLRAPTGWFGLPSPINRQSLPAAPSFFALAPQYIVGLVTTFAFAFGVILLFDLVFNNANIIERITGQRGAKAIKDLVGEINVDNVMSAADEVYSAIEKYQDLQKSQLPK